uniref:Uncharacterized protein n=1 Tax=Picea glauca TaxID=3330 RepID=A0A101M4R5_PICGL|nr:hypothetical protein ABT39_MTgene693 [Picea glauca]
MEMEACLRFLASQKRLPADRERKEKNHIISNSGSNMSCRVNSYNKRGFLRGIRPISFFHIPNRIREYNTKELE